jgi:hypothetical protein
MLGRRALVSFWALALVGACAAPARGALPTNWKNQDIGEVTRPGSTSYDPGTGQWTVMGEGSDLWGTTDDHYQYAYTQLKGDGQITARLLSQKGGHDDGWARNGLVIRDALSPDDRHLDFVLGSVPATPANNSGGWWYSYCRPDKAANCQWNVTLGNFPQSEGQAANRGAVGIRELPEWVRLQRQGNLISAYLSPDGKVWSSQIVPQSLGSTPLPDTMYVGLGVCGHNPDASTGDLSTMVCDNVSVTNDVLAAGPSGVEATPSQTDNEVLVTFTGVANATGYTIYRQAVGDTQYNKAGTTPGLTWFIDNGAKAGTNYRYVVTATVPPPGGGTATAETAASYPALVSPGPIPTPIGSFNSYDIGTNFQGSTTLDGQGTLTIQASGTDIYNAGDGMRFVGTEYAGNVMMTAKILAKPTSANTDGWVKGGLMIRESLDPAARMAYVAVTTDDDGSHAGAHFQWRKNYNDNSTDTSLGEQDGTDAASTTFPQWLRIVRRGLLTGGNPSSQIEGWQSKDGTTFTKMGGDSGGVVIDRLNPEVYIGIAVTNHRDGDFATAMFDAKSVTFQPL